MDAGILRDTLTIGSGILTGVMSGSFGVGGAVLSTPAIRALGCSAAMAVGTTLPSILPGGVSGSWKYRSHNLVRWDIVKLTVASGVAAAVIGALISEILPGDGHPLMILTALLLFWISTNLISGKNENINPDGTNSSGETPTVARFKTKAVFVGVMAGGLSGLLGVGGGIIMVPAFRSLLRIPMKTAIATSLICVGCFAIPGTITHTIQGGVDWRFAVLLTVGVIPGAPLGAKIALSLSDEHLRRVFGVFLAIIAVVYAGGEIAALV